MRADLHAPRGPSLRTLLAAPGLIVAPGCYDVITARLIEHAGFSAAYLTGSGVSLSTTGLPDIGLVSLHEVLERVCSLVEAESQGCITLVRDYDPSLPDVLIDREQMIQAVLNIVRNAMQAIGGQNELRLGRITLRSRATSAVVRASSASVRAE